MLVSFVSSVQAATLTVTKQIIWTSSVSWPFAISITCTNGSWDLFILNNGQSANFIYPDDQAIDCSVAEMLSSWQIGFFLPSYEDSVGTSDGRIEAASWSLVDWQTFTVNNTVIARGGKASSINEWTIVYASSVSGTQDSNNTTSTNHTSTVTLDSNDPYTCGAWFIGKVVSNDIAATTVTIDLQKNGHSVKSFTPLLDSEGNYNQILDYSDTGASNYVIPSNYTVVITASYSWIQDTLQFETTITDVCVSNQLPLSLSEPKPSYTDMLKQRNAAIIAANSTENNTLQAPTTLPHTGASIDNTSNQNMVIMVLSYLIATLAISFWVQSKL